MVAANSAGGTLAAAVPWATDATLNAIGGELPEHVYNTEAIPKWLGAVRRAIAAVGT